MSKPRIHILALGGTIATRPDATGAMQMGLGADDLVAAVPLLENARRDRGRDGVARRQPFARRSTRSMRSPPRSAALKADGVVVTQGTDTLEETGFLLDLLLDLDIPVIVTAAMRNPALTSPDGPGNLLAAVRVACDPWVRAHAKALGVLAVMLDEVYAASDVLKVHPTRLNAFASPQTGPLAALVEDRVVPLALPVRDAIDAARRKLGQAAAARPRRWRCSGWRSTSRGRLIEADARGVRSAGLSRRGARARWAAAICPNARPRSSVASPRRCRP